MLYQQIKVSTGADVGPPGPLPADLIGNPDSGLANLSTILIAPVPEQYLDAGFIPYTPPAAPVVVVLNKEQFVSIFTADELVAINLIELQAAGLTAADYAAVQAGTGTPTQQALIMMAVAERYYDATVNFSMNDPRIAAYLNTLSTLGAFGSDVTAAATRVAAILATPQP